MKNKFPHTIENCIGEKIIFKSMEGDKLILEAFCAPNSGPAMHTHFKQDESLTIISGQMGYRTLGDEVKYAGPGETILFKSGTPHKFWAVGQDVLHCHGWIQPANEIVFFLSSVYAAQNKSGKGEPDPFDGAYLLTKYKSEYDMPEIPSFVKRIIFPITVAIGRILGKYKHFKDSPAPL